MTREEFMTHAREEIDRAFNGQRNRLMNLVEQAWAEGKRNAEVGSVMDTVREALRRMKEPDAAEMRCSSFRRVAMRPGESEDRCYGVPGTPLCTCGGDRSKCDFYGG